MPAPHEIIASSLTVYLAPVGTAFPAIDADLTSDPDWELLGLSGANDYDEEGVTVSHSETVFDFTPAGSTMPVKRFRTAESFETSLNLVDLSPATYAKVMNDNPVTVGGSDDYFDLYRGDVVNSFAFIARGRSTINNELNMQYEFSKAFVSVNGDVQYTKGKVAMLPVKIEAVRHADSDIIRLRIANSAPS